MAYTTINKSTDYFNTLLYTGNGVGGTNITGVGFQPDLVWIKRRSGTENHVWNDAVRGVPNNIYSSLTNAQDSGSLMSAILSDGFTVQTDASVNSNNDTYVSWNWKANGAGSANTDGTISSTVSANTTAGFSIVSYTGTGANATVGHGLGSALDMLLVKNRDSTKDWRMWFKGFSGTERLEFNNTEAKATTNTSWNGTVPSSSLFSLGNDSNTNNSTDDYIAYCFAEKAGYSKFGSYTGNGNNDGPFIYLGFKPAFVIQKNTSATQGWQLQDNKRLGYNPNNYLLQPNDSAAESSVQRIDILSNGFKVRTTDAGQNSSGATYIYMAFGQSIVGSNNVPATAR